MTSIECTWSLKGHLEESEEVGFLEREFHVQTLSALEFCSK